MMIIIYMGIPRELKLNALTNDDYNKYWHTQVFKIKTPSQMTIIINMGILRALKLKRLEKWRLE